ncbi:hypothetical protein [Pseudomonas oryzicola]|uniref:DUF5321 domain-containing protein n=1 Tax=Pseudomonas oryzicola TaxID=485876 RepID=A0ABS6Q9U6_9PSED|nr:hypothetical protein [Pseudomonas oryzicola]MBV4490945.1 DUF5321 domain-containing protein [Pseudomonas oryzicola]
MSYSAPFITVTFTLVAGLFVGSMAINIMEAKTDLESSAEACIREMAIDRNSECDKAVAAKAKALQTTASALLPKS